MAWIVPALGPLERASPSDDSTSTSGIRNGSCRSSSETKCIAWSRARGSRAPISSSRGFRKKNTSWSASARSYRNPRARAERRAPARLLDLHADLPLFRYFLDARSPKEEWVFDRIQYLGGIAAVRARVLEGAGIAVLPRFFVRRDLASGRLKRLMPATKLPRDWLRMVWRQGQVQEARLGARQRAFRTSVALGAPAGLGRRRQGRQGAPRVGIFEPPQTLALLALLASWRFPLPQPARPNLPGTREGAPDCIQARYTTLSKIAFEFLRTRSHISSHAARSRRAAFFPCGCCACRARGRGVRGARTGVGVRVFREVCR